MHVKQEMKYSRVGSRFKCTVTNEKLEECQILSNSSKPSAENVRKPLRTFGLNESDLVDYY
jgi:hypothetical protein